MYNLHLSLIESCKAVKVDNKPLKVLAFCRRFSSSIFTVCNGWRWRVSRNTRQFYPHKRNSRYPLGSRTSLDTVARATVCIPMGKTPATFVFRAAALNEPSTSLDKCVVGFYVYCISISPTGTKTHEDEIVLISLLATWLNNLTVPQRLLSLWL